MASTYSTNLAIELIGTGDQAGTWGNTTNTNLGTLIEQAISGYVTQAVSTGTDTTITIPNGATGVARNMYIELTGTGGTNTNLIVPANKKLYFIFNNASGAVTVKVSGQTGVSVPAGKKVVLASNGTDTVNALNYIADFGSNSATITQLTATSATITNLTLTSLVISNLSIASANVTVLTSASATITNLLATTLTVSGVGIFPAGSAASAAITTTGDTNTGIFFPAADTIAFAEGGVESMRINSAGNLGLGTTSPTTRLDVVGLSTDTSNNFKQLVVRNDLDSDRIYMGAVASAVGSYIQNNAFYDNSFEFKPNDSASEGIHFQDGAIWFSTNSGLTSGVNFTPTERMRLTTTGLGIGVSSPTVPLEVQSNSGGTGIIIRGRATANSGTLRFYANNGTTQQAKFEANDSVVEIGSITNVPLVLYTNGGEKARLTAGGDFQVGSTNYAIIAKGADTNGQGWNGAQTSLYVGSVTGTGRSINAAGTVNASGADYAEYMEKAGNFVISKGDVCGISANGKLTNVYADAVSFVVKSTNPSYVGNDGWGGNYENDAEGLEAARQKVDRIAFAGQVPVNVLGATPGQYIVPANDNGAIKGVAVSNPSFEQYQAAVGKVIAVEDDGRARIIVKIA